MQIQIYQYFKSTMPLRELVVIQMVRVSLVFITLMHQYLLNYIINGWLYKLNWFEFVLFKSDRISTTTKAKKTNKC
jgi:hypothetical protein